MGKILSGLLALLAVFTFCVAITAKDFGYNSGYDDGVQDGMLIERTTRAEVAESMRVIGFEQWCQHMASLSVTEPLHHKSDVRIEALEYCFTVGNYREDTP